ncbi:hypothetical protein ES702_06954 [subsurface metagenome]
MICKRCKKLEAVEGKKNCVACAKYMSEYMKQMRAKKKVLDSVKVPKLKIHEGLKAPVKKVTIFREKREIPKIEQILMPEFFPRKMSPEDFRYFYFLVAGKTFRGNVKNCILEIIQILQLEILNLKLN